MRSQIVRASYGPGGRIYFPEPGIAKFDELAGTSLDVVFSNDTVTVYRVLPSTAEPA